MYMKIEGFVKNKGYTQFRQLNMLIC